LRAPLVLLCAAALSSPVLAGCGGTAKTDDCRISVDCSVMPFPAQSATAQPLAAIRSGPTFPPDPADGAVATVGCPASFRPVEVYPALPVAHAYRGPIVVGFNAMVPAGYALWVGDLTTGSAQEQQLLPATLPFPATLRPYPYANPATYAVTGDVTLRAGDAIVAYIVAPAADNCAAALADSSATVRSTP
jgi:hypothetical protein